MASELNYFFAATESCVQKHFKMFGWENQVDKDTKTLLNNDAEPEDEEIEEMDTYLSKERR